MSALGCTYACKTCGGTVYVPHAAAWPELCPMCRARPVVLVAAPQPPIFGRSTGANGLVHG